jgi:hypothetical protein
MQAAIRSLPILFVAALAACSSTPAWQKPGATPDTVQADQDSCRADAKLAFFPPRTAVMGRPWSSSDPIDMQWVELNRASFEAEEFRRCMRAKGYTSPELDS